MTENAIKLLVVDFDGTALGGHLPYDQFPPPFCRFLDRLTEGGVRWATNTTWAVENQIALIKRSPVKSLPLFVSASSGRRIAVVKGGRLVIDARHDKMVLAGDERFRKKNWPMVRTALLRIFREGLVERLSFNTFGHNMIGFQCSKKNGRKVRAIFEPLLASGEYYPSNLSRTAYTNLLPKYMNKGLILRRMQERFGIKPESTIVAGDGGNDIPMLDTNIAGWLVCPANADPVVKQIVKRAGGIVARRKYSWGVMEGVEEILARVD